MVRKTFILFFGLFFLSLTFIGVIPQKIQAAESAEWTNNFTITYKGEVYVSDNADDNWHFFRQSDPDPCPDEIKDLSWKPRDAGDKTDTPADDDTTVKLQRRSNAPTGCVNNGGEIDINLTSPNNATTGFVWDGEFIKEASTQSKAFKFDEALGVYLRTNDNECTDSMRVSGPGASVANITLRSKNNTQVAQRDAVRTSNLMDPYSGHAWVSNADYKNTVNDCWESEVVNINLGQLANARPPGSGSLSGTVEAGADADEPSCESGGGEMSWILCPMLRISSNFLQFVDEKLNNLLSLPSDYYNSPELQATWARMRNIAYAILIPIMLVMVISTAIGFDFISAYTFKKALPRLVIAIIFMALSFEITKFLIILTNDVGKGLLGLITSSFSGGGEITIASLFDPGGGAGATATFGVILAGALAPGLIAVILLQLFIAGMSLLIALLALAFRQMLLIMFMVLAPLAILAWIFPGNDKFWKLWWGSFSKLLLLYPIIMILIGSGRAFAWLVQEDGPDDVLATILKLTAYVAPYFLIPAMFKMAGGVFATVTGMANDRSKGLFDRTKNARNKKLAERGQALKSGTYYGSGKEGSIRSRLNTGLQAASMINRAGIRPGRMRENLGNAIADARWEGGHEAAEKIPGAKAFFANDDGMLATLYGGGDFNKTANWLTTEKGYSQDQARMVAAQGLRLRDAMGAQSFGVTALSKLPGTGTAYKGEKGIEAWLKDVDKFTGGNKSLSASIIASGKGGFRNAQQYEFSEAGFGDMMGALDMVAGRKLKDDGTRYGDGEVGEHIVNLAYKAVGASGIVNARNDDSARTFARAAQRDLQAAIASGDKGHIGRAAAQIENIRDASSSGKRTVTDAYLNELSKPGMLIRDASGQQQTIVNFTAAVKASGDQDILNAYDQVKHDFSRDQAAAAAAAAAAGAAGAAAAAGGPAGGGPGAGTPGAGGPGTGRP